MARWPVTGSLADADAGRHLLGSRSPPSPLTLLLVLLALNFLLYFDRGAVVRVLMAIRADPAMHAPTDAESGLLVSSFIVGYMLSCPIFAALQVRLGFKPVVLASLVGWAAAGLATALAQSYAELLVSRVLAGVGEAAFISFAMTTTDNIAPAGRRTTWIGAFYAMVPLGMAAGIAVGGVVSGWPAAPFAEGFAAWRVVFLAEVGAACPVLVLFTMVPSRVYRKPTESRERSAEREGEQQQLQHHEEGEEEPVPLPAAFVRLLRNLDYVLLIAGFCVFSFVATALAVWGIPTLVQGPLRLEKGPAAALIAGATAFCGVIGALLGGGMVDFLGGSHGDAGVANCLLFNLTMLLIAIPCGLFAFLQAHLWSFLIFFVVAMFCLFLMAAPVNACILTIVPPPIRPYAIAISVFFLHIFGDFPSPTIVGMLSDRLGRRCMRHTNEKACHTDPSERCSWRPVSTTDLTWRCWYEVQLRNALLITFSLLTLTLLCWYGVYRRVRARLRSAGVILVANTDPDGETGDERGRGERQEG